MHSPYRRIVQTKLLVPGGSRPRTIAEWYPQGDQGTTSGPGHLSSENCHRNVSCWISRIRGDTETPQPRPERPSVNHREDQRTQRAQKAHQPNGADYLKQPAKSSTRSCVNAMLTSRHVTTTWVTCYILLSTHRMFRVISSTVIRRPGDFEDANDAKLRSRSSTTSAMNLWWVSPAEFPLVKCCEFA